jgi:predicted metal-binding membrane protein
MDPELAGILNTVGPIAIAIVAISVGGWVITTWMRIKNGYPLDGGWGQAVYPKSDQETMERVKLLTSENAQLRAELGSLKDRVATMERIVTAEPAKLAQQIDQLKHVQ